MFASEGRRKNRKEVTKVKRKTEKLVDTDNKSAKRKKMKKKVIEEQKS